MTRTLEVGVRKAVGATRHQLSQPIPHRSNCGEPNRHRRWQWALPKSPCRRLTRVVHRQLGIEWLSVETGIGALTLALVVGALSGLYPAQVVARLHPVWALARNTPQPGRGWLGRGLIIVQFALSAVLVVVTITMARQLNFMRTKDLGFDGDQVLLAIQFKGDLNALQIERLTDEINSRPGLVQGVTGASVAPGFGGPGPRLIQSDGNELHAKPFYVSPNFLSVMGIEVLSGQGFDPNLPHGVLLNETAARLFGSENLIGRTLTSTQDDGEPMTVIGIVEDFHFVDMRHTIGPAFLTIPMLGDRFRRTLFRLDRADLPAAVEEVKALWKRVLPEYELWGVRFLDEVFAAKYETEQRVGLVMGWMSAVAIAISCMGLLGLVALAVVRRTKEIGIRKVLGATTGSVLLLMVREFGWLVVAANVVAWPVAYFVLNRWLAFYAYRIDMGLGWFVVAGVGVLAVALATVSSQTWLAARTNPADALRYE